MNNGRVAHEQPPRRWTEGEGSKVSGFGLGSAFVGMRALAWASMYAWRRAHSHPAASLFAMVKVIALRGSGASGAGPSCSKSAPEWTPQRVLRLEPDGRLGSKSEGPRMPAVCAIQHANNA